MTEPFGAHGAKRRPALPLLTSLRFFAATNVVVFHFFFPAPTDFLRTLFSSGLQSVTFFFVLSGFILAYVYSGDTAASESPKSARAFLAARAGRILPAYALGLVLGFPLLAYGALISKITPIGIFIPSVALTPLLLQSFYPAVANVWNPPAWSLSVEMVFYLLFPLILHSTRRIHPLVLLIASYALLLGMQTLRESFHPSQPDAAAAWNFYKFFPAFHLPTFIFGFALGRAFLFLPGPSERTSTLVFLLAAGASILALGLRTSLPIWVAGDCTLVLLFGAVIYGAARPGPGLQLLSHPWMVLLGEASYAMYILHYPLMFWWEWVTRDQLGLNLPPLLDLALFLSLVGGVSIATLKFFEQPLRPLVAALVLQDRRRQLA